MGKGVLCQRSIPWIYCGRREMVLTDQKFKHREQDLREIGLRAPLHPITHYSFPIIPPPLPFWRLHGFTRTRSNAR